MYKYKSLIIKYIIKAYYYKKKNIYIYNIHSLYIF